MGTGARVPRRPDVTMVEEAGGASGGGGGSGEASETSNVFGLDQLAPHCCATVAPLSCHCCTSGMPLLLLCHNTVTSHQKNLKGTTMEC